MVDLVVAAHRDDEVLGAGGLLAKMSGLSVVCYLGADMLCRPTGPLWKEAQAARTVLNLAEWWPKYTQETPEIVQHFQDNAFDTVPILSLTRIIERAVAAVEPDTIYTHWPHDLNQDHAAVAKAVLIATRPVPGQTVKAVYGFEVPSSTEWAFGSPAFSPNVFQPLTDEQMEKKRKALRCYASEVRPFPHPRSLEAIDALARWRGSQCGHPWAEAFVLLREVR